MRLPSGAQEHVARAQEALAGDDLRAALAALEAAAGAAEAEGGEEAAAALRLSAERIRAAVDGPEATLAPLERLGDRARSRGWNDLFALVVLERADQLRAAARLDDAANHAQVMYEWGRRIAQPDLAGAAALSLGVTLRLMGRLEEAAVVIDAGLEMLSPRVAAERSAPITVTPPLLPALPSPGATMASLALQGARVAIELGDAARASAYLGAVAGYGFGAVERAFQALVEVDVARATGRRPPVERVRAVVAELARGRPSTPLVALLRKLAELEDDVQSAMAALDRAEALAREVPRPDVVGAEVAMTRAAVLLHAGRLRDAVAALPELATVPAELRGERAMLHAAIGVALGRPSTAIAPALEAAAQAEAAGDVAGAAAAHQMIAMLHRLVGATRLATGHRRRAAELFHRAGLRARLRALEVERAWVALIDGDLAEARAAVDGVGEGSAAAADPDIAAQVALVRGAIARASGRPADGLAPLTAAHARATAAGETLDGAALAYAVRALAGEAGVALPTAVAATLAWAKARELPEIDPVFVPPRSDVDAAAQPRVAPAGGAVAPHPATTPAGARTDGADPAGGGRRSPSGGEGGPAR